MRLRHACAPSAALLTAASALLLSAPAAHAAANPGPGFPAHYAAPYVETWNSPGAIAAAESATGLKYYTLAFVINGGGSCNATFNGDTAISDAGWTGAVNTLRASGGDALVSFGGASGTELAEACTSVSALQAQYQRVIDTLNLTRIDLDVEGATLDDTAANDRRNQALANLQSYYAGQGRTLSVDYTLPVDTTGLESDATSLLSNAASHGLNVNLVNIMTMDYGPNEEMGQAAISAAQGLHTQLGQIWPGKSSAQLWAMEGNTPMIGVNDSTNEVFTTGDASTLESFAKANGIQELAYWALGRDVACASNGTLSDSCSGTSQSHYQFASTFNALTGSSSGGGGSHTGQVVGYGGLCLDDRSASSANFNPVQVYTCNGTAAQQWTVPGDGTLRVLGKCLDVNAGGTADGTAVDLYDCNGTGAQVWQAQANGSLLNPQSGKCLDDTNWSTTPGTAAQIWSCSGNANQKWTLPTPSTSNNPFGPNVLVFDPSESSATIQSRLDAVYSQQQSNQFGGSRYALLFKPGSYNVNVNVGFYTQVLGLGQSPDSTVLTGGGVHADAQWNGGNATENFWRGVENLTLDPSSGSTEWAVSQASPMRRVHIEGNAVLDDNGGWSSGGFLGDAKVDGQVNSGSQQQWLSRNDQFGSWTGSNWNMVFVGDTGAPAQSFPSPPYTTVGQTPVSVEKPNLYVDSAGDYNVFVPAPRTDSTGADWTNGQTAPGTSLPLSAFYIATPADTSATLNAALAAGKNLIFTPGVYQLSDTLHITRADTVVLGLGLATLVADNGVTAISTDDVGGVRIAGLIIDAGTTNSPSLMQIGPAGASADHSADPTVLSDVYFRVGGAAVGKATQTLQVNANNTIGDDLWLWRADHGSGVGWSSNTAANGLVVNGRDVTMYGLAVEHYQKYQVQWNANGGRTYFYQSEMPYDPPSQAAWANGGGNGWASYEVAPGVTDHQAWGLGVYCYFNVDPAVVADRAIEVPTVSGVALHDAMDVSLGGTGTITHIVNSSGATVHSGSTVADLTAYP